jgi:large conductance mechanosensitive channel
MFKEFKEFAMRGNVLDMAVGIVIGAAFGAIVTSFVADVLMSPLGHYDTLLAAKAAGAATLNYGLFINAVVNFLIVAFAVFLLVRAVNRMQKKQAPAAATTRECPRCLSNVPLKATRCAFCTSDLSAA